MFRLVGIETPFTVASYILCADCQSPQKLLLCRIAERSGTEGAWIPSAMSRLFKYLDTKNLCVAVVRCPQQSDCVVASIATIMVVTERYG